MTDDSLIQALPELVAFIRRDGNVLRELGGRRLGLTVEGDLVGRTLSDLWPGDAADLLLQMIRRALRERGTQSEQASVIMFANDQQVFARGAVARAAG